MSVFHFPCPNCQAELSAPPGREATAATCPECEWTFYVPASDPDRTAEPLVKFFCPHCQRKLSATEDQFATEMPCPFADCGKPVLVPSPEWKADPVEAPGIGNFRSLVARAEAITRR